MLSTRVLLKRCAMAAIVVASTAFAAGGDASGPALGLDDTGCLAVGLSAGGALRDQRRGRAVACLGHEDRAEDRKAETGGVVAYRLSDSRGLPVGEPRCSVDGIGYPGSAAAW